MKRFIVEVDGKWQGGSFATPKEADAVGRASRRPYEVHERRSVQPANEQAPSDDLAAQLRNERRKAAAFEAEANRKLAAIEAAATEAVSELSASIEAERAKVATLEAEIAAFKAPPAPEPKPEPKEKLSEPEPKAKPEKSAK